MKQQRQLHELCGHTGPADAMIEMADISADMSMLSVLESSLDDGGTLEEVEVAAAKVAEVAAAEVEAEEEAKKKEEEEVMEVVEESREKPLQVEEMTAAELDMEIFAVGSFPDGRIAVGGQGRVVCYSVTVGRLIQQMELRLPRHLQDGFCWGLAVTNFHLLASFCGQLHGVLCFSLATQRLTQSILTEPGNDKDSFSMPKGVAVDVLRENVFVVDTNNFRIKVLSYPNLQLKNTFGEAFLNRGNTLQHSSSIALDQPLQKLFVAGYHGLTVFSADPLYSFCNLYTIFPNSVHRCFGLAQGYLEEHSLFCVDSEGRLVFLTDIGDRKFVLNRKNSDNELSNSREQLLVIRKQQIIIADHGSNKYTSFKIL